MGGSERKRSRGGGGYPTAASLQAQGQRDLGLHITQGPGQHKDCGETSERTSFLSGRDGRESPMNLEFEA